MTSAPDRGYQNLVAVTVLIPTFDHVDLIENAIESVRRQSVQDFEVLVVGDGAPARTRQIIDGLAKQDGRFKYFEYPKGPRNGEIHRHEVLRRARGRIVCYISDDDLWLPDHLEVLCHALESADFAHTLSTNVFLDGHVEGYFLDLSSKAFIEPYLQCRGNGFGIDRGLANDGLGISFVGHRLDAYRRLPRGWQTAPPGSSTDNHMWRQFVSQPWCRVRSVMRTTALHFSAPERRRWSQGQKMAELEAWLERMKSPPFRELRVTEILENFGRRYVSAVEKTAALSAENLRASRPMAAAEAAELRGAQAKLSAEQARARDELRSELARIYNSRSWRVTAPFRAARRIIGAWGRLRR